MNALTDKRGALYPLTQSQKRTAAAIPTISDCTSIEYSGLDLRILNFLLSTPKIRSIAFRREAWRRLKSPLAF
jgi:hypothetical protein